VEDQLLVALDYWREYRTQFHIGVSFGIHETKVGRIIRKVEDILEAIARRCLLRTNGEQYNFCPDLSHCRARDRRGQ